MDLDQLFLLILPKVLLVILRIILTSQFSLLPYDFTSDDPPQMTYDFIVVGSGPGGSAVASRLSETAASVLVLEAGGNAPPYSAVPALGFLGQGVINDWQILGKPQKNAQLAYKNNATYFYAGKVMGGTSTINAMIYVRGNKKDYDNWAGMGNTGWDWQSVLPYFMKSENFKGNLLPGSESYHGTGGPVQVESRCESSKLLDGFLKAGQELGYDIVDGSGPNQIGVGPMYFTKRSGVRASASENFLRPVIDRDNLDVRPNAMVTKVIFNNKKKAVGVEFIFKGERRIANARKEVILSAGALNTPKLLLLSGVGPKKHLVEMGIPIVAEVDGVGQNLMDHVQVRLNWRVSKGSGISPFAVAKTDVIKKYIRNQTGFLADPPGFECNAWFNVFGDDPTWSDVQFMTVSAASNMDTANLKDDPSGNGPLVYDNFYDQYVNQEALAIIVKVVRARSRGSVTLASSDHLDNPVVDMNFFNHPDDMIIMMRAIRLAQKLSNTSALKDLGTRKKAMLMRACLDVEEDTDAYWECYIRQSVGTLYHYGGTAKMAPDTDPMGVVNPRLSVRGVSGLRVVDASIMPQVVTANTHAPTYMIGEKAADMIKEDWGYNSALFSLAALKEIICKVIRKHC